ncbi:SPASM domain-containing protein [Elizabethkingia meningoseptica]|nr:SPASM domain-containing protein [Elizabethkingia meningoseptica]
MCFCSAQTGELIFDPYGDLYSCWETVGIDKYKVGTYRDQLKLNENELENWYGRNISTTPACSKCKYAFFLWRWMSGTCVKRRKRL